MNDDMLESDPTPVEQRARDFFTRAGAMYAIHVTIPASTNGAPTTIQFGIKADDNQLPYAREILTQLRGGIGQHGDVTMTPITIPEPARQPVLDRLPGTTEAYAIRPPQPAPKYIGKHRETDPLKRAVRAVADLNTVVRQILNPDDVYDYSHIQDPDA